MHSGRLHEKVDSTPTAGAVVKKTADVLSWRPPEKVYGTPTTTVRESKTAEICAYHLRQGCDLVTQNHLCGTNAVPAAKFSQNLSWCMQLRDDQSKQISCAVVGSSSHLLSVTAGSNIDAHDVVIRLNAAPSGIADWEWAAPCVGSRTSVRFTNKYGWTDQANLTARCIFVLEHEQKCGAACAHDPSQCAKGCAIQEKADCRGKAQLKIPAEWQWSQLVADSLHTSVARSILSTSTKRKKPGGHPSPGFTAFTYALRSCDRVSAYGFGKTCAGKLGGRYYESKARPLKHAFDEELEIMEDIAREGARSIHLQAAPGWIRAASVTVHQPPCANASSTSARHPDLCIRSKKAPAIVKEPDKICAHHLRQGCDLVTRNSLCGTTATPLANFSGDLRWCMQLRHDTSKRVSCALVGSSGHLLSARQGPDIDGHDVVIRVNGAPSGTAAYKWAEHCVGTKTHVRFTNQFGVVPRGEEPRCIFVLEHVQKCGGGCWVNPNDCDKNCAIQKGADCRGIAQGRGFGGKSHLLADSLHHGIGQNLLATSMQQKRVRGNHRTAGFTAFAYALGACDHVSVYGFGESCAGQVANRYYKGPVTPNYKHPYNAELEIMEDIAREGPASAHLQKNPFWMRASSVTVHKPPCLGNSSSSSPGSPKPVRNWTEPDVCIQPAVKPKVKR